MKKKGDLEKEYYRLMIDKLKKEIKKEKQTRATHQFYNIGILYTTILFLSLAQFYTYEKINEIIPEWQLKILVISTIFSTGCIFFGAVSNALIRFKPRWEEHLVRVAIACFIVSTGILFIFTISLLTMFLNFVLILFLFLIFFLVIFVYPKIIKRFSKKKEEKK